MNIETAKGLRVGQTVYHVSKKNADGTPMRAKVLSVKTWKRNPEKVVVSVKHGMYDYAKFNETEIHQISEVIL